MYTIDEFTLLNPTEFRFPWSANIWTHMMQRTNKFEFDAISLQSIVESNHKNNAFSIREDLSSAKSALIHIGTCSNPLELSSVSLWRSITHEYAFFVFAMYMMRPIYNEIHTGIKQTHTHTHAHSRR